MTFGMFYRRVKTIYDFRQTVSNLENGLETLFSDKNNRDNVFLNCFNSTLDSLEENLIDDFIEEYNLAPDFVTNSISYFLWDADFGNTVSAKFTINNTEFDCTIWNTYCDLLGVLNSNIWFIIRNIFYIDHKKIFTNTA